MPTDMVSIDVCRLRIPLKLLESHTSSRIGEDVDVAVQAFDAAWNPIWSNQILVQVVVASWVPRLNREIVKVKTLCHRRPFFYFFIAALFFSLVAAFSLYTRRLFSSFALLLLTLLPLTFDTFLSFSSSTIFGLTAKASNHTLSKPASGISLTGSSKSMVSIHLVSKIVTYEILHEYFGLAQLPVLAPGTSGRCHTKNLNTGGRIVDWRNFTSRGECDDLVPGQKLGKFKPHRETVSTNPNCLTHPSVPQLCFDHILFELVWELLSIWLDAPHKMWRGRHYTLH
mmetsp:Transcript_22309/g.67054  ORF Transcript_22309/g.67054 Transcript_22309/m.67054 type:complete len:284 (+) Transcript_22309:3491-4342(+)